MVAGVPTVPGVHEDMSSVIDPDRDVYFLPICSPPRVIVRLGDIDRITLVGLVQRSPIAAGESRPIGEVAGEGDAVAVPESPAVC